MASRTRQSVSEAARNHGTLENPFPYNGEGECCYEKMWGHNFARFFYIFKKNVKQFYKEIF